MMKGLLQQTNNKKGVSEMVAYVLLIVIAVGLSILVYAYIKLYASGGTTQECKSDINLVIQDYTCENGQLVLTLVNKGLFDIDAAYVRLGAANKKILPWINDPSQNTLAGLNFRF